MEKEEDEERELQLMPAARGEIEPSTITRGPLDHPVLDLSLSISIGLQQAPAVEEKSAYETDMHNLKQQTAEQIRLAAVERAYAEQIREITRRELETAEKEFARARLVWERARQEVERVERMKEMATRRINSSCLEITCQACRQRFRSL